MKTANHPTFAAFQVLLGPLQELVELGTGWYKLQEHLASGELSVFWTAGDTFSAFLTLVLHPSGRWPDGHSRHLAITIKTTSGGSGTSE